MHLFAGVLWLAVRGCSNSSGRRFRPPKTPLGYRKGYGYTQLAAQASKSKAYARSSRPAGGAIFTAHELAPAI